MSKAPIAWINVIVFVVTTLISVIWVPYYAFTIGFDAFEITAAILCLGYSGMSITVGYHRLWSHKTYQTHPVVKFVLAIGGAFALQNSILHWSSDHRNHHRFVDNNDKDPYSAKRGFWFSHMGWMIRKYQGDQYLDYSNSKDLQKDKIVMWQHKHYLALVIITNFGIPTLLGWWHGDIAAMLLLAGVLRLVLSHHFTFFINSLAHIWGKQTYTGKHTARDNGWLALLTYGEGYHNYHHTFEYDYRNGIRWYQFDPSKWFINVLSYFGLAWSLRTAPDERIEQAQAKHNLEQAKQKLLAKPNTLSAIESLEHEYDLLISQINSFYSLRKRYLDMKKNKILRDVEKSELFKQITELKEQLNDLQLKLDKQRQKFTELSLTVA